MNERVLLLSGFLLLFSASPCVAEDQSTEPPAPDASTSSDSMKLPSDGPFKLETKFYDVLAPLQYSKLEGKGDLQKLEAGTNKLESGTSSNILKGYLQSDQLQSTLTTLQRKPLARLQNNLIMMQAKVDPNLDGQFAVQLARSRTYVDFLRAQMKAELDKVRSAPTVPDLSSELAKAQAPMNLNTSRISEEIEQERRKAKLILGHERNRATIVKTLPIPDDFQVTANKSRTDFLNTYTVLGPGRGTIRDLPSIAFQLDSPQQQRGLRAQPQILQEMQWERDTARQVIETERQKIRRQMDADLRSNSNSAGANVGNQLEGELARANRLKTQEARRVRGELDAIMTAIRPHPDSNQEVIGTIGAPSSQIISWDQWYARFTQAYEPQLLRAFRKYKDPAGSNTISITVGINQLLKASVYQKNPSKYDNFDRATIEAYSALNGSAILQFPIGSRRKQITFLIDNKHASSNPINGVESLSFSGDKEVLHNMGK